MKFRYVAHGARYMIPFRESQENSGEKRWQNILNCNLHRSLFKNIHIFLKWGKCWVSINVNKIFLSGLILLKHSAVYCNFHPTFHFKFNSILKSPLYKTCLFSSLVAAQTPNVKGMGSNPATVKIAKPTKTPFCHTCVTLFKSLIEFFYT